jgi:hypothetical protein
MPVARAESVLDHDQPVADARHLADRCADVREVVSGDPAHDHVEAAVRKRQMLGRCDHVGQHAGRGVDSHDLAAQLA